MKESFCVASLVTLQSQQGHLHRFHSFLHYFAAKISRKLLYQKPNEVE